MIRIGSQTFVDVEGEYVAYLGGTYADYFSATWATDHPPITPAHLWRANHLAAGWQIKEVRAFMLECASPINRLLDDAPVEAPLGDRARLEWFGEVLGAGIRHGIGIARLTKALHPLVPNLIPPIDRQATPWARDAWFAPESASMREEGSLGLWRMFEETAASQERGLDRAVVHVRDRISDLSPISRFGLLDAIIYRAWRQAQRLERPW